MLLNLNEKINNEIDNKGCNKKEGPIGITRTLDNDKTTKRGATPELVTGHTFPSEEVILTYKEWVDKSTKEKE